MCCRVSNIFLVAFKPQVYVVWTETLTIGKITCQYSDEFLNKPFFGE